MSARRARLAAALAAGALLLAPSAALAHAQLEGTSPLRGAVVRTQPAQVSFRFDEPVEGTFGAVRVYDGTGRRVDAGDAFHPGGRGRDVPRRLGRRAHRRRRLRLLDRPSEHDASDGRAADRRRRQRPGHGDGVRDRARAAVPRDRARFGTVWGIGVLAWLLVGALGWAALRPRGGAAELRPVRGRASGLALPVALAAPCAFLLLLPALGGHATTQRPVATGVLVRRALRAELALVVVVLGVTAALTSYPPSTFAQSGPVSKTTRVGPAGLELMLDPARVGANELHLYLLNPKDGTQYTRAQEVDVAESQPSRSIGPLNQAANLAGPGHYIVPDALLGVPGTWRIQVTVRVSDFAEYLATVEVPVR